MPLTFIRFGGLAITLAPVALVFRKRRKQCALLVLVVWVAFAVIGRFSLGDNTGRYCAAALPMIALMAG